LVIVRPNLKSKITKYPRITQASDNSPKRSFPNHRTINGIVITPTMRVAVWLMKFSTVLRASVLPHMSIALLIWFRIALYLGIWLKFHGIIFWYIILEIFLSQIDKTFILFDIRSDFIHALKIRRMEDEPFFEFLLL